MRKKTKNEKKIPISNWDRAQALLRQKDGGANLQKSIRMRAKRDAENRVQRG
jgi:hypothetical protein